MYVEGLNLEDEVEFLYTTLPKELVEKRKDLMDYHAFRYNTLPFNVHKYFR